MLTIIFLLVLANIIMLPFLAFKLSKKNLFFTQVESGNIKFVMRGETLVKIIHDVRGKRLDENNLLQNNQRGERKSFINRKFGIWWIGFPPFTSILTFRIKRETENVAGNTPETWITVGTEITVSSLRGIFPRPFVFRDIELGDRTTIDLMLSCKFEAKDPVKLVIAFKGDFFGNAGPLLSSIVNDTVKTYKNLSEFIEVPKDENSQFSLLIKNPIFNQILEEQVGLTLVGCCVSKYDPSDKAVLKAANAEAIALLEAKATRVTANVNAEKTIIDANAKKAAKIAIAEGKKEEIRVLAEQIRETGASGDVAAKAIADVLRTEAVAGENSKITTWVDGSHAQPLIGGK